MSDARPVQFHSWYRGVEIKADGNGNFFAAAGGHLLMRKSLAEIKAAIDEHIPGGRVR